MYILVALIILITINLLILLFFAKNLKIRWNEIVRAIFYGMITAIIIKGVVYGIGKQMNIDFYFFEIRILGKNALENFENMYNEFIKNISVQYSIFFAMGTIILPAILEEVGKLFSLRLITIKSIGWTVSTIREYIYRMCLIALGFSFFENFLYLGYSIEGGDEGIGLVWLMMLRIIMSTTSHLLFSGIIAYFYARFMFGKYDLIDTGGLTAHKKIISFLRSFHIFYSPIFSFIYQSRLFLIGLILAIGSHIFYNLMLDAGYPQIALMFIICSGGFCIYFLMNDTTIDKNLGIIQEKINLMKEMRNIQKRKYKLFGNNTTSI